MRQITIIFLLTFGLLSCGKQIEKPNRNKQLNEEQQKIILDKLRLDFNQPVLIDSSVYVMYPLTLGKNDKFERGSFSSSSGGYTSYWNIVFYNTANDKYHLLDDTMKMLIYSYHQGSSFGASSSPSEFSKYLESGYNQVDKLIYYSITTKDFNQDGKLNSEDPSYLFITDKAGENLKQVSPDNFNVTSWKTIKGTNKILLQVIKDSNNDKKFDEQDETIQMVYDLNINTISKVIFNDEFKLRLKKRLQKQWPEKE